MTPNAGQGAPFKKDGYPDPGAVIDGVPFDVKDQAWVLHGVRGFHFPYGRSLPAANRRSYH